MLFPGLSVPLHIFEPRYREMIADVANAHAMIGMTLLKGDWEADYNAFPDIFEVGCAGKIGGLLKLADGRAVRTTSVVRSPQTFGLPRAMTLSKPPELVAPRDSSPRRRRKYPSRSFWLSL